jgi:hypothetical protein
LEAPEEAGAAARWKAFAAKTALPAPAKPPTPSAALPVPRDLLHSDWSTWRGAQRRVSNARRV